MMFQVHERIRYFNTNEDEFVEEKMEKSEMVLKAMEDMILCDLPFIDFEGISSLLILKGELN